MSISGAESRLLIDGKLVEAEGGRTYDNINPATEEVAGQVADASVADMDRAIAAARRAFDESGWATDLQFRSKCVRQLHAALEKHKETLRPQIVAEVGCPIALTYAVQQDSCINDMLWDIEHAERYQYEQPLPDNEFFGTMSHRVVLREPVGVVGIVTPWNFPFMLNISKLAPALMAGNTVVMKAAPDTPWSATFLGKLAAEETDIPPGVFNVITAKHPAEVGDVLTGDPRVDMISFTGSTAVGKHIMARGAQSNLKRIFLELGGKSANIVLDDADFANSVPMAAGMVCSHAGQGCAITTRMLLPRSRYEEGVELAKAALSGVKYGDPNDMENIMGPLVNARQRERVLGYIEKGKQEGAKLVLGGGTPSQFSKGYYVEPTLFIDVDPDSSIAQEEIFGPVLSIIPFEDDDDAVRIANDSRYGLSGAVHGSHERAMAVARRVRTGTMSVNNGMWFGADSPFGGYKESGVGREHGAAGFEEYLETKTVAWPVG